MEGDPGQEHPLDTSEIATAGTNALAYYLPYHIYAGQWGIYLRAHGIVHLASVIKGSPLQQADASIMERARTVLFEHERFHFLAETACARAETVTAQPLYETCWTHRDAWLLEEALANAHAYRRVNPKQPTTKAGRAWRILSDPLWRFMQTQPPGYRDFAQWLGTTRFRQGQRQEVAYMIVPSSMESVSSWPTEFLFEHIKPATVPTRLIMDAPLPWLLISKEFPKYCGMEIAVHTNDHIPPHIHVQIPPGSDRTRYRWPELIPLDNDPNLSARQSKNLAEYLRKYGDKIYEKLQAVYGPLPRPIRL